MEEIIHGGALECFEFYKDYADDPEDKNFGWGDDFTELIDLTRQIVKYIEENRLENEKYPEEFSEALLKDPHYVQLSILGNKIELIILSDKTEEELEAYFEGDDDYYTPNDIKKAIESLEKRLPKK